MVDLVGEGVLMNIILMEQERDCLVAALATATQASYDAAESALFHKNLPGMLESPIFGNPINAYKALLKLGYWKKNVTMTELLSGKAEPMKTVVLLHNPDAPIMTQHWVVYAGKDPYGKHLLLWGNSKVAKAVDDKTLEEFYRRGWPNCSFTVYKANFWTLIWNKIKMLWS
jgi:hypothetical protein